MNPPLERRLDDRDGEIVIPHEPIVAPACWQAEDFQESDDWKYRLDNSDLAELKAALDHVHSARLDIIGITRRDFPLPRLGPRLQALRNDVLNGRGFALLKGLPAASLSRRDAAILYWGIGAHLGYPVPQNAQGHLLGHVVDLGEVSENNEAPPDMGRPAHFISTTTRGYNSRERFSFHVDNGDIVGLLCLHPARKGGDSLIVSSVALHNEIMRTRPDLLRVLYQPFWRDWRGQEVPAGAKPYYEMPVFSWCEGQFFAPYSPSGIRNAGNGKLYPELPQLTSSQREAVDLLDTLADDPRFRLSMTMEAGDIQFINNHVILHNRTAYIDFPELERRRHLLRLWLVAPDHHRLPHWHYERTRGGRRGGIYVPGMTEVAPIDP